MILCFFGVNILWKSNWSQYAYVRNDFGQWMDTKLIFLQQRYQMIHCIQCGSCSERTIWVYHWARVNITNIFITKSKLHQIIFLFWHCVYEKVQNYDNSRKNLLPNICIQNQEHFLGLSWTNPFIIKQVIFWWNWTRGSEAGGWHKPDTMKIKNY